MASSQSFSPLANLANLLTPPPPFTQYEYDGLEYRWKSFVFRPALFKFEGLVLVGLVVYFVAFFVGKVLNQKRANAWFEAHLPLLSQQFSRPTLSGLVSDGYTDFFNFSTGRRNIETLHCVFSLLPRHDLVQMAYRFAWGMVELVYTTEDTLELDFKLPISASIPGFVWGVVSKEDLVKVKQGRWDLTFTRTTESPLLGGGYCVMSEYADVSENLLKSSGPFNIAQALNDPSAKPYIKSLTITDQPRERPILPVPPEHREQHVILTLRVPPPSNAAATLPIVKAVFALVDSLETKLSLRPETKSKLKKTRDELDAQLRKEAEAEKKEEVELDKLAAKRKVEAERVSKLSASEQRKELERDRKRMIRKSQGKVVKK